MLNNCTFQAASPLILNADHTERPDSCQFSHGR